MKEIMQFYINGTWMDPLGNRTWDVINPATEEIAGRIAMGETEDVDRAVAAARRAFTSWSRTTIKERLALLGRIVESYQTRFKDMSAAISEEMGAPLWLAEKVQAAAPLGQLQIAIEVLKKYPFDEERGNIWIRREPIGVCGLITPWNWPAVLVAAKVLPALATGCTMILKPSEYAPFSAQILAEIMDKAEVPPGVFNLVNGDGATVGAALASHHDIDMISFTGSTRAGIDVATKAAPTVKRVHQELGGKSPNILLDDADFEKAVPAGMRDVMLNSGQTCFAPTRMLVPRTRMAEVITIARQAAAGFPAGRPADNAFMGPVVNQQQWTRIQELIEKGIEEGATLITGGLGKPTGLEKGYYVKPTVFADVTNNMIIAQEEIFGPVLMILGYEDVEEAISIANDTPYGLAAFIQGKDIERLWEVGGRIQAGQVYLNRGLDQIDLAAPFGGYKRSGNGREWGDHGFEAFLEVKAFIGNNPASSSH
jgi:aldehyde dehydrogenase (NAD+)